MDKLQKFIKDFWFEEKKSYSKNFKIYKKDSLKIIIQDYKYIEDYRNLIFLENKKTNLHIRLDRESLNNNLGILDYFSLPLR